MIAGDQFRKELRLMQSKEEQQLQIQQLYEPHHVGIHFLREAPLFPEIFWSK
jgi:hypothetical protein